MDNINSNLNGNNFVNNRPEKHYFGYIKEGINNINKKDCKNIMGNFNVKNKEKDSFDCNISKNSLLNKNNLFKTTKVNFRKHSKKLVNKKTNQNNNNNEIRVLKYKKVVYANSFLLNSYSTSKNIKKLNKITFVGTSKRRSKYRGVSKNGNQYQVLIMINKKKTYIGSYPIEEDAARIYDILSLKYRGIRAKTNFYYSYKQINEIQKTDIDIKNINQIISRFI